MQTDNNAPSKNPTTELTLEDALILAAQKHRGQVDKAGKPYILHPLRVMQNLGAGASDEERMAALLHDIVEDCDVSFDDLHEMGFPSSVVVAVQHLTKTEDEQRDYMSAIRRVAQNSIARRVKIADLTDNSDISRLKNPTATDYARLEKYQKAKQFLENLAS